MIRTFSEEMLGLPGRPKPPEPRKKFSESEPAEQYEKEMLNDVHEARKHFLTQITLNPMKFAKSCSSCLQLIDMDGEDYASSFGSRATSAQSSNMDMISGQSSVDEKRIARILRDYQNMKYETEDHLASEDSTGRRVKFNLHEYLQE